MNEHSYTEEKLVCHFVWKYNRWNDNFGNTYDSYLQEGKRDSEICLGSFL